MPMILIIMLACISIVVFLMVFQHYMNSLFEDVEDDYRQGLANIVAVARNTIEPELAKFRSGEIDRTEAIERIRAQVRNMTYKDQFGDNYVFMSSYDGTMLVQPYEPEKEMTSQWDLQDTNGIFIIRELIKAARAHPEGSFVKYHYYLPKVHKTQEKLAYVVGLPELESYIGSGMYMQRSILRQREIMSNIKYASVWLLVIVLVPISFSILFIFKRNRLLLEEMDNRRRAEGELKVSEKKYRSIFENAREGIFQTTPEGRLISVNPAFVHLIGYGSPEEMVCDVRSVSDYYADPLERLKVLGMLNEKGLVEDYELRLKRRDGDAFWVSMNARLVKGEKGEFLYYEGSIEDITKRKQAEESVRASRKFLNDLLQAASEFSIVATDPNGTITAFNRGAELILGYSAEEMIGKQSPLVLHLESELAERSRELSAEFGYPVEGFRIFSIKPELEGPETREWTFVRKDGSTLLVSLVATAIRSDKGEIIGYLGIARDITKSRQAEEKFSKIFMTSPAGIAITRLEDGRILDSNQGFEEISGWKRNEVRGLTTEEVRFWVDRADRDALVGELKAGRDIVYREFQFRRKDGAVRTGVYSARPIQLSGVECLIFIAQDITERKQAEEKFSKIFMMAPDMIGITRLEDGLLADVNLGFEEITGWKRSEVIGRTSLEIGFWVNREDRAFMVEELKAGRDVLHREMSFRRKDGALRTGVYSARSINIAGEAYLIFIMQDVTERIQVEEKFSKIFMTTPDCIAITRMQDGMILDVNPGFEEFSGWERDYAIGRTSHEIRFWVNTADRELMVKELEAGRDILEREFQFRRKDGAVRSGIYSARRIRIADETCLVFVMQDITDRRRLEEDRKRLESQLFQSQKMDAIGQLAGGVAHDFNNILMGITGNVALIMMDYNSDHPHYERLSRIEEHVERGARLTRQLLGFARGGKYEIRALSVNDLALNSAKFFVETRKEIEATFELQEGAHPVEGDAGQLEQVLLNIYINAGHAMPQGGRLHIQTANLVLQEEDARAFEVKPGDYVKISIADTGSGMDRETIKRIFEPFFTTKAEQGGTGLGLASAYGIVRNHGGAINAYSEVGKGSTFNIYLPSSEKKSANEKNGKGARKLLSGTGGILLVDDEPEILDTASRLLGMLGYVVYKAENGQDAIQLYRENMANINLVILDMIMPGTSGSQVLKALKEINSDVKVVLSSGYSLQGEAQNVMEMGCLGFIQKPYSFAQLSGIVHKALNPDSDMIKGS